MFAATRELAPTAGRSALAAARSPVPGLWRSCICSQVVQGRKSDISGRGNGRTGWDRPRRGWDHRRPPPRYSKAAPGPFGCPSAAWTSTGYVACRDASSPTGLVGHHPELEGGTIPLPGGEPQLAPCWCGMQPGCGLVAAALAGIGLPKGEH